MIIPYEKLSPEALNGLIEEFVTRPGTDTGDTTSTLEHNIEMVKRQLKLGDVVVVFDKTTQTANIDPKEIVKSVRQTQLQDIGALHLDTAMGYSSGRDLSQIIG